MKHIPVRLISGLLLTLLLLSPASAIDRITVVSDIWMPYHGKPGSSREGYAVEILRTVFKRRGVKVDYVDRPWKRAVEEVRSGRADILIGAFKDDLPDFIYPKQSLGKAIMCIYSNRKEWKFRGVESLKDVKTGMVKGYGYRSWFNDYVKKNPQKVQVLHGDDAFPRLIRMLAQDRVQAVPSNKAVMDYYIKTNGLQDVIFMAGCGKDGGPRNLYIALSPDNPSRSMILADIFDDELDILRKTGYLNHLLRKYDLKDWISIK